MKGRQILDEVLIANKAVHWMKKSKKKAIMLKLDFQKAYNIVKWSFVDNVLEAMGFGSKWRRWISGCVSSASMSVTINGSPIPPFKIHRDLRQGDLLSPFLSVLVTKVFNQMLSKAKGMRLIEGLRIGKDAIDISHLQFTDDTLLFFTVKKQILTNYRRLLDIFRIMSRVDINYSKFRVTNHMPRGAFGCKPKEY